MDLGRKCKHLGTWRSQKPCKTAIEFTIVKQSSPEIYLKNRTRTQFVLCRGVSDAERGAIFF